MSTTKRWMPWLLGMPVIILGLLFLWPRTGWIIRAQFGSPTIPSADMGWMSSSSPAGRPLAETSNLSADYETSLIAAIRATPQPGEAASAARVRVLWAMAGRFPNEPGLYAHILRFYTQSDIHSQRPENFLLLGIAPQKQAASHPSAPEVLARFDRAAAEGERLDPENAYFPHMRASGLLEANKDSEAVGEMLRAGGAQRWNDYVSQEPAAYDHVWKEQGLHPGALERMATDASILLPHFATCRATARIMIYKAVQAEAAGHPEEGLALRHAVMKVGSLMRYDSPTVIGNLVGIAISAVALIRPGGGPAERSVPPNMAEARKLERRQQYYRYLNAIGHADEAKWAEKEAAAGDQTRDITRRIADVSPMEPGTLQRLMIHWFVDVALLANALWVLVLAGVATMGRKHSRRATMITVLVGAIMVVTLAAWTWQSPWVDSLYMFTQFAGDTYRPGVPLAAKLIFLAIATAVPVMLMGGALLYGLLSGKPVWGCIVGSLRKVAPVAAGVLLLAYAGMIISTAGLEVSVQSELQRSMTHEGRFTAEKTHQVWPGR